MDFHFKSYFARIWTFIWRWHKDREGRITWKEWKERLKNAKIRTPEIERQNSLDIFYAPRRTGKSYRATAWALRLMEKGETVACNWLIVLPPWIDPKYRITFREIHEVCYKRRIHIFIDETQMSWNCRDFPSMPDLERNAFAEIGKMDQHWVLITQIFDAVDKILRDQATRAIAISRFWRIIHVTNYTRYQRPPDIPPPWEEMGWDSLSDIADWFFWRNWNWMNTEVWATFNTKVSFSQIESKSKSERRASMAAAMAEERFLESAPAPKNI